MPYQFKKGDVVRYKKEEAYNMPANGHGAPDATKEFIVESNNYDPNQDPNPGWGLVMFEGDEKDAGCLAYRLELVKQAPEEKKPKPEGKFAWGVFFEDGKIFSLHKTRQAARDTKQGEWYSYALEVKKIKYEIV